MSVSTFAQDVKAGLMSAQKSLPSKYFYDDEGSRIFIEIMEMPEYYLTDCEFEIFSGQGAEIFNELDFCEDFNLIELGAGDGKKTMELIRHFRARDLDFTYVPIDISKEANEILSGKMREAFPELKVQPKTGDYFKVLNENDFRQKPSLILFIGSNIGNYPVDEAKNLLKLLESGMKPGDKLLLGVDLKKDPLVITRAYDDPHGITRRFNLNLLNRINRELGGHFDLGKFTFYSSYDPLTGEVKSFHVSLADQEVEIDALGITVHFKKGETIWTELSKKYDLDELEAFCREAGLKTLRHFLDSRKYFTDTLLEKPNSIEL